MIAVFIIGLAIGLTCGMLLPRRPSGVLYIVDVQGEPQPQLCLELHKEIDDVRVKKNVTLMVNAHK